MRNQNHETDLEKEVEKKYKKREKKKRPCMKVSGRAVLKLKDLKSRVP